MSIHYKITGDNEDFKRKMRENSRIIRDGANEADKVSSGINRSVKAIGAATVAAFSAQAIKGFINEISRVRSEFQQLEIAFTTMLGSKEKADALMRQAIDTAAKTPFDLNQVATGYKQLLAYGIGVEKLNDTLVTLGDVASGVGAPLNDIVYLYGTLNASGRVALMDIRQFAGRGIPIYEELAKVLGIAKDQVNEFATKGKISFEHVELAFKNMTSEGGRFANLMEKQSASIGGLKANLGDAVDMMKNELGQKLQPLFEKSLQAQVYMVENYEEIGKTIMGLVAAYGTYRAVLISISAVEKINMQVARQAVLQRQLAAALDMKISNAEAISLARTRVLTLAKQGLGKTLKSLATALTPNPYVLAAAAVAGLTFAVYKLATAEKASETAVRAAAKAQEERIQAIDNERTSVEQLLNKLKDETLTRRERQSILNELEQKYPDILKNLDLEKVKYMDLADIIRQINDLIEQKTKLQIQDDISNAQSIASRLSGTLGQGGYVSAEQSSLAKQASDLLGLNFWQKMTTSTTEMLDGLGTYIRERQSQLQKINDEEFQALSNEEKRNKLLAERNAIYKQYNISEGTRPDLIPEEAESQLRKINQQIEEYGKTTATVVSKNKAYWEQQKKEAENALAELTDESTAKEWKDARKRVADAQKELDKYSVSTKTTKKTDDLEKEEREIIQKRKDLELEKRQSELDLMKESTDKVLKQIDLDYEKKLHAIDKEEQAELDKIIEYEKKKAAARGVKLDASSIGLPEESKSIYSSMRTNAEAERDKNRKKHIEDEIKSDQAAWNEFLLKYGDYQEKRLAITQSYEQKIKDARTGGEKALLQKQMEDAIDEIDAEQNKRTSTLTLMFSDMSEKSIEELKKIRDEAQGLWEFLSGGEWDAEKGAIFGITKNQFEDIVKDPDKLHKFKKGVDDIKDAIYQLDTPIQQIKEGLKDLFNPDNAGTNKMLSGLDKVQQGYQKYADAVRLAAGALGELGELTGNKGMKKAAGGLNDVMDVAGGAMDGAKVGSAFGPIGAIAGAVVGAAKKVFGILKRNKEERERLQKQIEENQEKEYYGQLEIEEVWRKKYEWAKKIGETTLNHIKREGEELKKQAAANEKAQSDLWSKLRKEQYKSGEHFKKTGLFGWGKGKVVEEWSSLAGKSWQQIETLASQGKLSEEGMKFYEALKKAKDEGSDIEQMQIDYLEKLREIYTGTTYDSLVSSIVEGFKQGKRSASDFAKSFEDLMQGALESSLSLLADESMRKWYEEFAKAGEDGYTQDEIDSLKRDWIKLNENLAKQAGAMEEVTGRKIGQAGQDAASYGSYEKITQDQADRIDGRLTGMHMIMIENSGMFRSMDKNLDETRGLSLMMLEELQGINKNTKLLNETNIILKEVKKGTDSLISR